MWAYRLGLDVEVVERQAKVQNGRNWVVDWTLKQRNARRKSKRNRKEWRIGRWSRGIHGGSPKGKKRRGGLDVKAEECTEEVQKEQERAVDWTLKRRKGAQKSKRRKYVHGNSRQAGVCSHRLRLLVSLAAYAIARSGACTRGSLAVIAIITCALAGCAVSIKSVGAVIHARLLAVFF